MTTSRSAILAHFIRARWRWHVLRGARLERWVEQRARASVTYAAMHAPFYAQHWAGHDLASWRTLPPVDREHVMAHFANCNTVGVTLDEALTVAQRAERERNFQPMLRGLTVGLSSGTGGRRGLFVLNQAEQQAWAGIVLARTLHRLPVRGLRVALFLRSGSNLYNQIGGARIQFRYFDLLLPLDQATAALNAFQPHMLVGPPSLLDALADQARRGALFIRPQRLYAVAEALEPQDAQLLREQFAAPVHQIYQCTEGLLAISCARGALHVQADLVALQWENAGHGRVIPLVTDLWRRAQPTVRYRLDDLLLLGDAACPCGSPWQVLAQIEGRRADLCHFLDGTGKPQPIFPGELRAAIMHCSPALRDYRAVQERTGQLRVSVSLTEGASFEAVAALIQHQLRCLLAAKGCLPAELHVVAGIPTLPPGVKRRRVQNNVGMPGA